MEKVKWIKFHIGFCISTRIIEVGLSLEQYPDYYDSRITISLGIIHIMIVWENGEKMEDWIDTQTCYCARCGSENGYMCGPCEKCGSKRFRYIPLIDFVQCSCGAKNAESSSNSYIYCWKCGCLL